MSGMPQGQWTLKADLAGDIRRLKPWPSSGVEPSLAAARRAVGHLHGLAAEEYGSLVLRYQDDEGDLCTLTDASLPDALHLATENSAGVLRLSVLREATPPQHEAATTRSPSTVAGAAAPAEEVAGQAAGARGDAWATLRRFTQHVQNEVRTTATELRAAASGPSGLREYSATLQGRLHDRMQEARTAATEARAAAASAYSHASQGDAKALGLAAAVAVPAAAAVALAPGRCTRLGLLAAGLLAAAKLGDSLAGSGGQQSGAEAEAAGQARAVPQQRDQQQQKPEEETTEAVTTQAGRPSNEQPRQRRPSEADGTPPPQMD